MALIPVYWWNKEVHNFHISQDRFVKQPWANGVVLLACVAVAMLLANLPFTKDAYHAFLQTEFTTHIASPGGAIDWYLPKGMTIEKFINDILMVIFFFTVGLEIKREVVCGELSSSCADSSAGNSKRADTNLIRIDIILHFNPFRIGLVVQDISRKTVKHLADLVERREADGAAFPRFEQGKVRHGDADSFGQLREFHVTLPEHFVEVDGNHIAR